MNHSIPGITSTQGAAITYFAVLLQSNQVLVQHLSQLYTKEENCQQNYSTKQVCDMFSFIYTL